VIEPLLQPTRVVSLACLAVPCALAGLRKTAKKELTVGGRYALNAVNSGSTSVGIRASNGVVIATEKKLPFLMDDSSFEKVSMLTTDIGMVYSGAYSMEVVVCARASAHVQPRHGPGCSRLVDQRSQSCGEVQTDIWRCDSCPPRALSGCADRVRVQERIPVSQLVGELASVMQEYTQSGGVRPFGVSVLVAGFDGQEGPKVRLVLVLVCCVRRLTCGAAALSSGSQRQLLGLEGISVGQEWRQWCVV
jgi:20S proteasome alpha/beta subunit